jgi:hypothetical protein
VTVSSRDQFINGEIYNPHPITDDPLIRSRQRTAWTRPNNPPASTGPLEMVASAVRTQLVSSTYVPLRWYQPASGARYPAVVANSVGSGRVAYLAAALDKAMYTYPDAFMRRVLVNAVKWAANENPPVEVDGPLALITTVRRQPAEGRTIVHLLNSNSSRGQHSMGYEDKDQWVNREEVLPLIDIKVICRVAGVKSARLQPENINLPLTPVAGGGVQVSVPRVDMYSMVVFSPTASSNSVREQGDKYE